MNEQQVAPQNTSVWQHIPTADMSENLWLYHDIPQSVDPLIGRPSSLKERGYERLDSLPDAELLTQLLAGGLTDIIAIEGNGPTRQLWAKQSDIARARERPVTLAFRLPQKTFDALPTNARRLVMAEILPPATIGYQALIITKSNRCWEWPVTDTGKMGKLLAQQLKEVLQELVGPAGWRPYHPLMGEMHQAGVDRVYETKKRTLLLKKATQPDAWEATEQELRDLEIIRAYVKAREQGRKQEDKWSRALWQEVQELAQQLLDLYWQAHQQYENVTSLPQLHPTHGTELPSCNMFRGLVQSISPAIRQEMWHFPEEGTIGPVELTTANGSSIAVKGEDKEEYEALHSFITRGTPPETLKHLINVIDVYHTQTGLRDQKEDIRVSLRQLLLRLGTSDSHADEPEEQKKLLYALLYFARTWVTAPEPVPSPERGRRGGRRNETKMIEYSPILVIERLTGKKGEPLRVPTHVSFHLGIDTFNMLKGLSGHFFPIPTVDVFRYHAKNEQAELYLAFYLADLLSMNARQARQAAEEGQDPLILKPVPIAFYTLLLQAGIQTNEDLKHGHDRTRDAVTSIYALEHLEMNDLIIRNPHQQMDTILAIDLIENPKEITKRLAERTLERLRLSTLKALSNEQRRTLRRQAIQGLLLPPGRDERVKALGFLAGPRLIEWAETRAQQRLSAAARDERSLVARVVKAAKKEVVESLMEDAKKRVAQRGETII